MAEVVTIILEIPGLAHQIIDPEKLRLDCNESKLRYFFKAKGYGWVMQLLRYDYEAREYVRDHFQACERCQEASVEYLRSIAATHTYAGKL